MFKKLVIASHNKGKVKEIGELLAPLGFSVVSAGELGVDEPEETGMTFAENAILKAVNTAEKTGLPALADDSGLAIPALGGLPGIYSARWAGADKNFDVAFTRIQQELAEKNIDASGVPAYFICSLCLAIPSCHSEQSEESLQNNNDKISLVASLIRDDKLNTQTFEGRIDGTLTFPPCGEHGFGYDPIFIPEGYNVTFAEMDSNKKHSMSHRARAFAKFVQYLKDTK
jgi:XTP/dITP diphosphohydrolase